MENVHQLVALMSLVTLVTLVRDLLKCWTSRSVSHKYPDNKYSVILSPRNPVDIFGTQ